jgi:hypothetical protein
MNSSNLFKIIAGIALAVGSQIVLGRINRPTTE